MNSNEHDRGFVCAIPVLAVAEVSHGKYTHKACVDILGDPRSLPPQLVHSDDWLTQEQAARLTCSDAALCVSRTWRSWRTFMLFSAKLRAKRLIPQASST